ncbi:MAG: four helix bundle protein [Firmicutes bacterium]|nr:four helix bundle protein [Bacillota bacterium]
MKENAVKEKALNFAVRIVNLYKFLREEKNEHIMSKQLMRSGTSIGANISEALRGASKKDFMNKLTIALKEAGESDYWITLLRRTDYLDEKQHESISSDISEIIKLLVAILKRSQSSQNPSTILNSEF